MAVGLIVLCALFIRKFRMKSPTTSTLEFVINEVFGIFVVVLSMWLFSSLFEHRP